MRGRHASVGLAILMLPAVAAPGGCGSSSGGYGFPAPAAWDTTGSPNDPTITSRSSAAAPSGTG